MNFILAISLLAIALPLVDRPISINSQFSLLKGSMLFPTISEARESGWIRIDSVSAWPIDPTTPLAVAGGQEGDRAISIGSEVVTDTDQFKRLIGEK